MKWFINILPNTKTAPGRLPQARKLKTIYCQMVIVSPKVTDVPLLVFAVAKEI